MPVKPRISRTAFPRSHTIGGFAPATNSMRQTALRKPRTSNKAVFVEQGPDISENIALDAERYLLKKNDVPSFKQSEPDAIADWFAARMIKYKRENRRQHYENISAAYAMYAASLRDPVLQMAVAEAATRQKISINDRKSRLRIILELHISYGTGIDAKSIRQAGKNYSRDVSAIANLIKRGVMPSEVLELAERKGEGLDEWVRWKDETKNGEFDKQRRLDLATIGRKANSKRRSPFGRDEGFFEYENRTSHFLVWETRNQSGEIVSQDEVKIDETNVAIIKSLFDFV